MIRKRFISWRQALAAAAAAAAVFVAGAAQAQAQDATITGRITGDQGQPLSGATVTIPALNAGVNTNSSGTYTLVIPQGRARGQTVTLTARYIGHAPQNRQITLSAGQQTADFKLARDVIQLTQVVVTGVADATETTKVPFAVGVVGEAQLQQTPGVSPLNALAGKVAGARVIEGNAEPGTSPTVRLRSATSLTGSQNPLIIIDGTITRGSLADINSQDIERIEVIKGAAASSLYGSDAANGVVQIFTRRGANNPEGEVVWSLRNEGGMSQVPRFVDRNEAHYWQLNADGSFKRNAGGGRIPETDLIADNPYPAVYDQQKDAIRSGAFYTNYISLGQRRENTNYNVSFQNTRNEGIIFGIKGYTRQNFRVNLDQNVGRKLDMSFGAFYGKSNNESTQQGVGSPFFALTFVEPDIDLTATGTTGVSKGVKYDPVIPDRISNASNPLYSLANVTWGTNRRRFMGNTKLRYRIFDWLSAEGNYDLDEESSTFETVTPKGFISAVGTVGQGNITRNDFTNRAINTGATLTSVRQFGWVANTTKASFIYETQNLDSLNIQSGDFTVARTPELGVTRQDQLKAQSPEITIRNRNTFLVSTFEIKDRYILDGLVRRDESSLFGPDSRSSTYYRLSGAYRLTEDFKLPGVDELKLRASQGTAGLRPIFNAQYETFAISPAGIPVKQTLGNRDLRPALSTETELGFNLDFLHRFGLEYTHSRKITEDQILLVPLSGATGYQLGQWRNAGTLKGQTHEMAFKALLADSRNLTWQLNLTGDRTRQKITRLAVPAFMTGPRYDTENKANIFRIAAGQTFGVMYGTRVVRNVSQLYDDPAKKALSGTGQAWAPESVLVNEEGFVVRRSTWRTLDERPIAYVNSAGESIVQIGDVNPNFTSGAQSILTYKAFTVSGLLNWVSGGKIYNGTRQWPFFENRDRVYDQRSKPVEARKPASYYNFFYNAINPIDYFVEPGSYVKLKELAVTVAVPTSWTSSMRLNAVSGLKVGVIGRNLWTSTNYSGYDPEVSGQSGDPYSFRFDSFNYPNFRTFTGVIDFSF